jgi:hypothetical protein
VGALRNGVTLLVVLAVALSGAVAVGWVAAAMSLPDEVSSKEALDIQLKHRIETDRASLEVGKQASARREVTWEVPDVKKLPAPLVGLAVAEAGCPGYLQSPREEGAAWLARVLASLAGVRLQGDGACEYRFARAVAGWLGASTEWQLAVAADTVHQHLQKEELVAYFLETMSFGRALIGIDAAAKELFLAPLASLDLAALAELQLAIPPHAFWEDIYTCRNAAMIRQSRDALLDAQQEAGLATPEAVAAAKARPVRCLSVER